MIDALAPLHPRPGVPGVGEEVDRSFEVALPAAVEGRPVAVAGEGATILLPRETLEALAAADVARWSTEPERQGKIAAARARRLLAEADGAPAAPVLAQALGDAVYAVGALLEAGLAAVLPEGAGEPVRSIVVRYFGTHPEPGCGFGDVSFLLPGPPRAFLRLSWFSA